MTDRKMAAGLCLLSALAVLFIATTSSPLYATNFWTDTNIYFTIGRGMTQGLVPYRDLFDHKGPILYMLYALGALLSGDSFLGVFLLQVLSLVLFAYLCWVSLRKFCGDWALAAIPILCTLMVTTAYNQGGSAEEFCLPALGMQLLCLLREGEPREKWRDAAFGASLAFIFWTKYTLLGLGAVLGLGLFISRLMREGRKGLWMVPRVLCGFLGLSLVPVIYLALNHTLQLALEIYFLQNLTYAGKAMTLRGHLWNALAYLRTQSVINPGIFLFSVLGVILFLVKMLRSRCPWCIPLALSLPLGAGMLLLTVYWGELAHPYYALAFAGLCPAGLLCLSLPGKLRPGTALPRAAALALCALSLPLAMGFSPAWPMHSVRRQEMPQVLLAAEMKAEGGGTLLDLSGHDQGFYLAAGEIPVCRYFADNNLNTEEKQAAIQGYIETARTDYVVTRYRDPGSQYQPVMTVTGVFDLMDPREYTLYRRCEDASVQ